MDKKLKDKIYSYLMDNGAEEGMTFEIDNKKIKIKVDKDPYDGYLETAIIENENGGNEYFKISDWEGETEWKKYIKTYILPMALI